MKKSILMLIATVAIVVVSCKESPYIPSPGDTAYVPDTMPVTLDPDPTPDPDGLVLPEGTINVYEAIAIGKKLHKSSKDN